MAGSAGYNIPISVSAAETFSVPQSLTAPSYIIFGSGNRSGEGDIAPANLSYAPATAVSTAAEGNASSSNQQTQPSLESLQGFFQQHTKGIVAGVIGVIVGVAILTYLIMRKR